MIEVNEYVRTTNGKIAKYIGYNKELELHMFDKGIKWHYEYYTDIFEEDEFNEFINEDIVKHNKIISEVVEVGDYVNGKLIHKIDKGPNYCYLYYGNCNTFVDYQIKTILTKEQFEANCYKVGGEE